MFKNLMRQIAFTVIAGFLICLLGTADSRAGNISSAEKYAWSETAGWSNFNSANGGDVTVYSDHLEGHVWAENIGWIRLGTHTTGGAHTYTNASQTTYGVNHDGSGNLSGYGWSENAGWINFDSANGGGVTIDSDGNFGGYAWGENVGWIHFQYTTLYKVAVSPYPEPANHVTGFSVTGTDSTKLTVGWTDSAAGAQAPDGYLILAGNTSFAAITDPTDTIPVADDTDLSDGSGAKNIGTGVQTYQWTGLSLNTTCYFKIYPYTNFGGMIAYKTDGTVPSASGTTTATPEHAADCHHSHKRCECRRRCGQQHH